MKHYTYPYRTVLVGSLAVALTVLASCSREDPDQLTAARSQNAALEQELDKARAAIERSARVVQQKEARTIETVIAFLDRYPFSELPQELQETLVGLGIDPEKSRTFSNVDLEEFISLATVYSFLEKYPYKKLPPGLASRIRALGIDTSDSQTYLGVDPVDFAGVTGGHTWDSHVQQVEIQKVANARANEIRQLGQHNERLKSEKAALSQNLQSSRQHSATLNRQVSSLEGALDGERRRHEETRHIRDGLEVDLNRLRTDSARERAESGAAFLKLERERVWVARQLELERRGADYRTAALAAGQVVERYRSIIAEMTRYYERHPLLVADFVYRINSDGSVTGLSARSGFQNHSVWVRTTPGLKEEKDFERLWKSFRTQVKSAMSSARRARKKSDSDRAANLGEELEQLLRQIPEKLWIAVKAPSGGRFRLDLTQTIEPIIGEITAWERL